MIRTKLQISVAGAFLLGGVIVLISQHRTLVALREKNVSVQTELAQRAAENARLTRAQASASAEVSSLRAELATAKAGAMVANRPAVQSAATPTKIDLPLTENAPATVADTDTNRRKKAGYHKRYDPFFAQRGFSPQQVERLLDLFIVQDEARQDLQASVRSANLSGDTAGIEDLRSKLYAPILREIQDIMGNDGYAEYNRFQRTSYYRMGYIERMSPAFASANAALTEAQRDLLVGVVADNDQPVKKTATDIGSESRIDWDMVATKTVAFLNPQQQAALQSFVASERARQR